MIYQAEPGEFLITSFTRPHASVNVRAKLATRLAKGRKYFLLESRF